MALCFIVSPSALVQYLSKDMFLVDVRVRKSVVTPPDVVLFVAYTSDLGDAKAEGKIAPNHTIYETA